MNAFMAEMEPDIRAADRDMLEIDTLEKKGVLGAGKLTGVYFVHSLDLATDYNLSLCRVRKAATSSSGTAEGPPGRCGAGRISRGSNSIAG